MKKPAAWPRQIIEVRATRRDRRADPHATAKISRAEIDAALARAGVDPAAARADVDPAPVRAGGAPALARTSSGMQRIVRPAEDSFPGPRDDDGPEVTIRSIDSVVEFEAVGPLTPSIDRESSLAPVIAEVAAPARQRSIVPVLLMIVLIIASLALAFFAGRMSML